MRKKKKELDEEEFFYLMDIKVVDVVDEGLFIVLIFNFLF